MNTTSLFFLLLFVSLFCCCMYMPLCRAVYVVCICIGLRLYILYVYVFTLSCICDGGGCVHFIGGGSAVLWSQLSSG